VGTRFAPDRGGESAFKLWLRYAKPTMGRVRVDGGAEQALAARGTSLLPVGVVACDGAFAAGDAVEVLSADGARVVGKGISALSADELRQVAGLKSAEVRRRLPDAAEEVVHRDQFVLL
jgi:glutamate 5-kinase